MKEILIALPTAWDDRQVESCRDRWGHRYRVVPLDPSDADCPADFDPEAFVGRVVRERGAVSAGVFSSSDYPGATLAAAISARAGWPGPSPDAVIRCSHKYYSRLSQLESVPEATPPFALVRPDTTLDELRRLDYPRFVKPVKGAFSVHSRRADSAEELHAFLDRPLIREFLDDYLDLFHRLVEAYTDFDVDGRAFLAEGLLRGRQFTVEGWAGPTGVEILGIVDSVLHPRTNSFVRFDYPSELHPDTVARAEDIACRAVSRLGLTDSMFNIEMIHDPQADTVHIIEVNPRICGQFGDLYHKVDGVNGYEVALALAAGDDPPRRRREGAWGVAASVPLRVFEPVRVARAPDAARIAEVERDFPGTLVWTECETGQNLSDFEHIEDGSSCRYAVVNLGAERREDLDGKLATIRDRLGYSFRPL